MGHYGNAILSRYPLEDPVHIDLTVRPKKKRGALVARWRVPVGEHGKLMTLVNLHIGLSGIERQWQLRKLFRVSHLTELRNRNAAGDWRRLQRLLELARLARDGAGWLPARRTGRPDVSRLDCRCGRWIRYSFGAICVRSHVYAGRCRRGPRGVRPFAAGGRFRVHAKVDAMQFPAFGLDDPPGAGCRKLTGVGVLFVDFLVKLAIGARVIMQRRPTGETLAWIMVVFSMPVLGPLLYLMLGELRLGRRRAGRFTELTKPLMSWLHDIRRAEPGRLEFARGRLQAACRNVRADNRRAGAGRQPRRSARRLASRYLPSCSPISKRPQSTVHLEFYIWSDGGEADRVVDALVHAQRRGVTCRVLVDALGSHRFLRGKMCSRLREAGVNVVAALPGGLFRLPFVRFDLRLHRKIVVIDGRIGYTGSINLVDPRYFKKNAGVGEWIDAMVRVEGPAVEAMQIIFLADWYVESHAELDKLLETADAKPQPSRGDVETQVMPSGPDLPANAIEQVLLTAIYSAREELLITTPYFVPSEPLMLGAGGGGPPGREGRVDPAASGGLEAGAIRLQRVQRRAPGGRRADRAVQRWPPPYEKRYRRSHPQPVRLGESGSPQFPAEFRNPAGDVRQQIHGPARRPAAALHRSLGTDGPRGLSQSAAALRGAGKLRPAVGAIAIGAAQLRMGVAR